MNSPKHPRIIFLNQMAAILFRELAKEVASRWYPSILFTGHPDTIKEGSCDSLIIKAGPMYDRTSSFTRIVSWLKYSFKALFLCLFSNRKTLLFFVPFPPLLGIIAYICKKLKDQHYVVLVYDIYPDIFVRFGPLNESGLVVRIWHYINKLFYENADVIFTIGEKMANKLETRFDVKKTITGKVVVIPNWADVDKIKPIPKGENPFALRHGQLGNLTVMYSGNLGQSHDIETILAAICRLRNDNRIHFMIIGDGAKKKLVDKTKKENNLQNLTVLPFQPEDIIPFSLTTAEVSIVTLDKGSEGLSVPSKTFYAMASGSALIGLCDADSEVAQLIERHQCGVVVQPGDVKSLVREVLCLLNQKERLEKYRFNSRLASEQSYSKKNIQEYIDVLSTCTCLNPSNI